MISFPGQASKAADAIWEKSEHTVSVCTMTDFAILDLLVFPDWEVERAWDQQVSVGQSRIEATIPIDGR